MVKETKSPSARPLTMKQIAAKAGVHQTTVSLALRDHPRLPLETRKRIRALAERMGYRPDPLLGAFNFHRNVHHAEKGRAVIGFILDAEARRCFSQQAGHPLVVEAARRTAKERGYSLELFLLDPKVTGVKRLGQILLARGIEAVVISTFEFSTKRLELPWDRLSAVKIEGRHLWPSLPVVTNDQYQVTRMGVQKLRELGYRRIGLVAAAEAERRLGDAFRMGLTIEEARVATRHRVPPLVLTDSSRASAAETVSRWIREHRVEAIASNLNEVADYLRTGGFSIPDDIAFCSLDLPSNKPHWSGVVQNHGLVGQRAVEHVLSLLYTHQRGVPQVPSVTFIPGYWHDGESAPGRQY